MDIKKILIDNNIKIIGDKISKTDFAKAMEAIASATNAGVSEIELDRIFTGYDEGDELGTISMIYKAKLDLSNAFLKHVDGLNDEDALELYDNMDFVDDNFKLLKLDDALYYAVGSLNGPFRPKRVECQLGFWSGSSFDKVKEDASNKDRAESLKAVDVTIDIEIFYEVDPSLVEKAILEALKKSVEKLYK